MKEKVIEISDFEQEYKEDRLLELNCNLKFICICTFV